MTDNLHPSVREFKTFLQQHPKLMKEVRKRNQSLQPFYEKWALLGEDDPFWDQYKEQTGDKQTNRTNQGKAEWMEKLVQMSERVDMDKVQKQVQNLSETIATVQGLLNQFQSSNQTSTESQPDNQTPQQPQQSPQNQNNLFSLFKD